MKDVCVYVPVSLLPEQQNSNLRSTRQLAGSGEVQVVREYTFSLLSHLLPAPIKSR